MSGASAGTTDAATEQMAESVTSTRFLLEACYLGWLPFFTPLLPTLVTGRPHDSASALMIFCQSLGRLGILRSSCMKVTIACPDPRSSERGWAKENAIVYPRGIPVSTMIEVQPV
jgi:hypothetical protein